MVMREREKWLRSTPDNCSQNRDNRKPCRTDQISVMCGSEGELCEAKLPLLLRLAKMWHSCRSRDMMGVMPIPPATKMISLAWDKSQTPP